MIRLALQNFFDQVVEHKSVAARKRVDEASTVSPPRHRCPVLNMILSSTALEREPSHLQTGNPAFGAGFKGGDGILREVQTHRVIEEFCCFRRRKAQIGRRVARSTGRVPDSGPTARADPRGL